MGIGVEMSPRPEDTPASSLASWSADLDASHLPMEVTEKAQGVILDFLSAALLGASRPHLPSVRAAVLPPGEDLAAATDAQLAHVISVAGSSAPQWDDVWTESLGHPGVGVVPVVLSAASRDPHITWAQALRSIVVGYEIAMRVGSAVGKQGIANGWHPRGGLNAIAAAGTWLALHDGTTAPVFLDAFGLAANGASGLVRASYFYDAWFLLSGQACAAGVEAARLAASGLTAHPRSLDHPDRGYITLISGNTDHEVLRPKPGDSPMILRIGQKPHQSSGATHAAADATLEIRDRMVELGLRTEDVVRVTVAGFASMHERLRHPHPSNPVHGGMSIPFVVASALRLGRVDLQPIWESQLVPESAQGHPDELARLQDLIEVIVDPRLEAMTPERLPARVEIGFSDGTALTAERLESRGDQRIPMTSLELREKFHRLTAGVIDAELRAAMVSLVDRSATDPHAVHQLAVSARDVIVRSRA